jgi:CBS domain-containing protein
MAIMIGQSIRHLPVLVDGALVGIVSIRDVVQSRLDELEMHAKVLEQYVTGSA